MRSVISRLTRISGKDAMLGWTWILGEPKRMARKKNDHRKTTDLDVQTDRKKDRK